MPSDSGILARGMLAWGCASDEGQVPLAGRLFFLPCSSLKCKVFHERAHLLVLLVGVLSHGLELHLKMARPCLGLVQLVLLRTLLRVCVDEGGRELAVGRLVAREQCFGIGEEVVERRRSERVCGAVREESLRDVEIQQLVVRVVVCG